MSQTYTQASVFTKGSDAKIAKNVFIPADAQTAVILNGTASFSTEIKTRPVHQVSLHLNNTGSFDGNAYFIPIGGGSYYLQSVELFKYGAGADDATVTVSIFDKDLNQTQLASFNLSGTTNGQWVAPSIDTGSWGTLASGPKGDVFVVDQLAPSGSAGAFVNLTFGLG